MLMFNLFKSKKQEKATKELPVLKHSIAIKTTLKLSRLEIKYNMQLTNPYTAIIEYKEKPENWSNENNQTKSFELHAKSWPSLLDKVADHFAADNDNPDLVLKFTRHAKLEDAEK